MPFCPNCGHEIERNAKFCFECGTQLKEQGTTNESQRKTVYDGEIHKCPNCGEVLGSFTANCPTCGYELRGTQASGAVREFAAKLEAIERERESVNNNPFKSFYFGQTLTKTDERKISLIRSFAIPKTKEDLYEFLILAKSNIDVDSYDDQGNEFKKNDARRIISEAWKAQFEQAYEKARIIFVNDPRLNEIQAMHDSMNKSISSAKWKSWKFLGIVFGILIVFLVIVFTFAGVMVSNSEKKEIERLENVVAQIEDALEERDYKLALMNAQLLDFDGNDAALEEEWTIKRDYWIDKIRDVATADGVNLDTPGEVAENVVSVDEENTNKSSDNQTSTADKVNVPDDFIAGYEKADFFKFNSSASGNSLVDSKIYFRCTLDKTEILEADGTTSILGYVTDDSGNEWLIQLHFVPAVSKTAFDSYKGKELVLRGVYSGFSGTKEMPVVVLDEMIVLDTGENVAGMQKLLDE